MKFLVNDQGKGRFSICLFILLLICGLSGAAYGGSDSNVTYTFTSGSTAKSSEVNANFDYLEDRCWDMSGSNFYLTGGNVGIGTNSPEKELHIVGTSNDAEIRITNSAGVIGDIGVAADGGSAYESFGVGTQSSHRFDIYANGGAGRLSIASDGNVGIGTTSPSKKLHIKDGSILITGSNDVNRFHLDVGQKQSAFNLNA